jgi:NAD(P)-dependent dehydrogenase (short-subunit alcohol dehydrogenase family)
VGLLYPRDVRTEASLRDRGLHVEAMLRPRRRSSTPRASKVIVVTGAASGIGAAITREAVGRGYQVAACDINLAAAEALFTALGPDALALQMDVRVLDDWTDVWDLVVERFETIDVVVNNAGIIHTGYARELSLQQHRDMMDVNYFGVLNGVMTALPRMREQGHGHIINVCSMTSFLPLTGYATYGATKHAVRAFHHALAMEERHSPIRFSIIHPPSVQTPMLELEMADPSSVLAFAEKATAPEVLGRDVIDAIEERPIEVVFPRFGGRVQRLAGSNAPLMHALIPKIEKISAARKRLRQRAGAARTDRR